VVPIHKYTGTNGIIKILANPELQVEIADPLTNPTKDEGLTLVETEFYITIKGIVTGA
jgi:hypothetical protein